MAFSTVLKCRESLLMFTKMLTTNFIQKKNLSSLTTALIFRANQQRNWTNAKSTLKTNLNLYPVSNVVVPNCGIKVVGKPKPRCKHCYYCMLDGVLHIMCDMYPRHKQRAFIKRQSYKWILTHACMSKVRPY